jgi:hypothetical protein
MTYDDQDNSWLDAMVSEVPVAPVNTARSRTARRGLWHTPPELAAKISQAVRNSFANNPELAKQRSKNALLAWQHNEARRAEMSARLKGKTFTQEHRAKISAGLKLKHQLRKGISK